MARWRLTGPHYLNVPGTEWEYSEITRDGKQSRKRFAVPTYLDPASPPTMRDPNGRNDEIIVCHVGKGQPNDVEFEGDPSPDMIPLDDEAKAISQRLAESSWKVQPELLQDSFGAHLERNLEKQLIALRKDQAAAEKPLEGVQELLAAIGAMMQQNQQILNAVIGQKVEVAPAEVNPTPAKVARRA